MLKFSLLKLSAVCITFSKRRFEIFFFYFNLLCKNVPYLCCVSTKLFNKTSKNTLRMYIWMQKTIEFHQPTCFAMLSISIIKVLTTLGEFLGTRIVSNLRVFGVISPKIPKIILGKFWGQG